MRSRYAAYALGLVEYVVVTTDPEGPAWGEDPDAWREGIERFCRGTRFVGLQTTAGLIDGDRATVEFRAQLLQAGHDASFAEASTFVMRNGRWLYHDGARLAS